MTSTSTSHDGVGQRRDHIDRLFVALSDEYRRTVLHYFQTVDDDEVSLETLVDYTMGSVRESPTRDRLEVEFHHATLPKLVDLGVVEYDYSRRVVRYCGPPVLQRLLAVVAEEEQNAE